MNRNFVVKNDFNRAATHKSIKDYDRKDVKENIEEELDLLELLENIDLEWESNKETTFC